MAATGEKTAASTGMKTAADAGTEKHATIDILTDQKVSVCTLVVDGDGTVKSSAADSEDQGCYRSMAATGEGKKAGSGAEIHAKIDPTDQEASDCPPLANGDGTVQAPAADTKTQTSQNAPDQKLDANNRQTSVPMGVTTPASHVGTNGLSSPGVNRQKKLSTLPLIFLIFYEVSGGPFGIEDTVGAAGPLLALVGFLVFPLIWSIPEALITAEMSTMYPENGGYVVWVSAALGPFWGFQQGWMKWLGGVIDNALYLSGVSSYSHHLKKGMDACR